VLEVLTTEGLPERVLRLVGGERTMTDLRHVAEVLHEAAQRDGLGLNALLEWLRAAMAQDAPGTSGARTRRLDSDAAAVQLVTIHGSKGLQYPHRLSPGGRQPLDLRQPRHPPLPRA
jgi:exodeoxyribonuclease V beta subunit